MRVVVIIPTYNESENIKKMLSVMQGVSSRQRGDDYKILVVDDNSPDGTGKIVEDFAKIHKNFILLTGIKKGLGVAMIRGIKYAIEVLKADIVVSNEADFAFDPTKIPFMVSKIKEGYDVVIGSRHIGKGKATGWTISRKLNHWIANQFFATWIAGVREVHDHNGAFRAIRVRGLLNKIDLEKLPVVGFGFFNYFIFRLARVTGKFYEFPVVYKFRTKGESKVSFNPKYIFTYVRDIFEYIKLSFKIRIEKATLK